MTGSGKLKSISDMSGISRELRGRGKTLVFTNGCFDLIHVGHVRYLRAAKALGDKLVAAVNSDASIRRIKGSSRPIIPEDERMELLAALEMVDYVTGFNESDPERIIKEIKPQVLVKGADWAPDKIIGRDIVEQHGGKVVLIPEIKGFSSSGIINEILSRHSQPSSE
ncbi:MAG: D-glycero-beta-D-manno-heptose 1-phosphate adenylyltransferase [bacterium]